MYDGTVDARRQRPDERRANNIMHILFACVCEVINMRVVTYMLYRRKCSADRTRERERDRERERGGERESESERESVREKEREREGERDIEHVPAPVEECSQGRAFSFVVFCWVQTTIA